MAPNCKCTKCKTFSRTIHNIFSLPIHVFFWIVFRRDLFLGGCTTLWSLLNADKKRNINVQFHEQMHGAHVFQYIYINTLGKHITSWWSRDMQALTGPCKRFFDSNQCLMSNEQRSIIYMCLSACSTDSCDKCHAYSSLKFAINQSQRLTQCLHSTHICCCILSIWIYTEGRECDGATFISVRHWKRASETHINNKFTLHYPKFSDKIINIQSLLFCG